MITDRHRCGADGGDRLVRRVAAAARAGVHLVQVRERDLEAGPLTRLVGACVAAVRGTPTRVIVNDRFDVALAAGAHGVHLRSDSPPAGRVRATAPAGFLVGRSVHSIEEARRATAEGGVDYLIVGTVFSTSSKPRQPAAGEAVLARIVAATSCPVLAVGGVTVESSPVVARTGAAGVAAIGLFMDGPDESLQVAVSALHMAFDIPGGVP